MAAGAKRTLVALSILSAVAAMSIAARHQDSPRVPSPTTATVCEILRRPADFDGRIVTVRATVVSNFEVFAIRDVVSGDCGLIWLTYAGGGPVASVSFSGSTPSVQRPELPLRRDREFARYERALEARMYGRERGVTCIGCGRYEVTVDMTGRVDAAPKGLGFGHLNGFSAQFVLTGVSRVQLRDRIAEYDRALFSPTPVRFPTGHIVGKVTGPEGRPITGIHVRVAHAGESPVHIDDDSVATDQTGAFKIAVPPGVYTVAANVVFPPSAQWPYPRTWAPASTEEAGALRFTVADGRQVEASIRVPIRLAERRLRVRVTWPDGTPVPQANAWLAEQGDPQAVVGIAVSHTDGDGRVELTGLSGVAYVVRANVYVKPAYRPFCARSVRLSADDPPPGEIAFVLTEQGQKCASIDPP